MWFVGWLRIYAVADLKDKSLINSKKQNKMRKFKISTIAAIAVYAMLAVVFLMWVFGLYYLWTSELSYIMCFMFTTFGAAGWVYFVHIIDDKVRY